MNISKEIPSDIPSEMSLDIPLEIPTEMLLEIPKDEEFDIINEDLSFI